ncbi:hypothetical protein [Pedobacter sp. Leaf250]|uniref:hypothetical protein n=1 Tax=Pedobacter sp. Leaf250 TaxID=2876559 RepID=UPI001E2DAC81|nr:hypothetical protein [Pedobacter sp. Leaf250]
MTTAEYNKSVRSWAGSTKRKIKLKVLQQVLNIGPGHDNQQVAVKNYAGEAAKIDFSFPYYMAFVHKGAGRGYGGNKTGSFFRPGQGRGTTSAASMGKMGTGKRKPKPWFNPVIEAEFPALANLVADHKGDKVMLKIEKILVR